MLTIVQLRDKLAGTLKLHSFYSEWRRLKAKARNTPSKDESKETSIALIVPCDPWTVVGSKGDEAMITAAVQNLRSVHKLMNIHVLCTPEAASAVTSLGYQALPLWKEPFSLDRVAQGVYRLRPQKVAVLGADVMDGHYSPFTTNQLLAISDLCFVNHLEVSILGFSFNATPSRHTKRAFSMVEKNFAFKVRDPLSLERFNKFTKSKGKLVADAAFCMQPTFASSLATEIEPWMNRQHAEERSVVVVNIHPMLFPFDRKDRLVELVDAFAYVLERIAEQANVSWLLLPHDYRTREGDDNCLVPLAKRLAPHQRTHLAVQRASASEIKGALKDVSGVITGRMHLAIAALGMGIPVCALTYQDKFQGLFQHFELDSSLLMTPIQATDKATLYNTIREFIEKLSELRIKISTRLPTVLRTSAENFEYSSIDDAR